MCSMWWSGCVIWFLCTFPQVLPSRTSRRAVSSTQEPGFWRYPNIWRFLTMGVPQVIIQIWLSTGNPNGFGVPTISGNQHLEMVDISWCSQTPWLHCDGECLIFPLARATIWWLSPMCVWCYNLRDWHWKTWNELLNVDFWCQSRINKPRIIGLYPRK